MPSARPALVACTLLACAVTSVPAAPPVPQFGPVTPVAELNSTTADSPAWISDDGLKIVFQSTRNGYYLELFSATRPSTTSPFSSPTQAEFAPLNPARDEMRNGVISPGGLELFYTFTEYRPTYRTRIVRATRADAAASFSNPEPLPALAVGDHSFCPSSLSPDALRLYYFDNAGHAFVAARPAVGAAFAAPSSAPFAGIGYTDHFTLTPDERQLFYSRGAEIYWSYRPATDVPFPAGTVLPSLSGIGAFGPTFSAGAGQLFLGVGQSIVSATVIPEPASCAVCLAAASLLPLRRRRARPPVRPARNETLPHG